MDASIQHKIPVRIPVDDVVLEGDLAVPERTRGLVLFAHGSGSSRFSSRNTLVANFLNEQRMATLLFDLLTSAEDTLYANRFDIPLLARRLKKVKEWVRAQQVCKGLPLGYFGASTGAAAALLAAAGDKDIAAVVSRGGRPDLVLDSLPAVQSPTLLLVGSLDTEVLWLNQRAFAALTCEKQLQVIAGASHLFEERGTMTQVCDAAAVWFKQHFKLEAIA
ncbi:dienelactone hydrolase family protein [Flavisolibacter nicotianae]|uniref:dienelactone hydrolase family protein n=1 Tax=Flavisolibacter nicotianae TaxID=2364882 RepID=UPI000EAFAB83|nr:alpha/beta family hydrolase [Flavisolibacter nicotianae]